VPDWIALGDRAIRFPRPSGSSTRALLRAVRAWPAVTDIVVTREDVAVYFDAEPRIAPGALEGLVAIRDETERPRTMEIRAIYDGPDLADVARSASLSEDDVVRIHASAAYEVELMGFAPGFAYLTGLDPRLHLARRQTPRPQVPAGTIAIAGGYTGVYPFDSPGGWHLIGRVVGVRMFSEDGALLHPGDRVRFVR
jgi:UPF0271 protein